MSTYTPLNTLSPSSRTSKPKVPVCTVSRFRDRVISHPHPPFGRRHLHLHRLLVPTPPFHYAHTPSPPRIPSAFPGSPIRPRFASSSSLEHSCVLTAVGTNTRGFLHSQAMLLATTVSAAPFESSDPAVAEGSIRPTDGMAVPTAAETTAPPVTASPKRPFTQSHSPTTTPNPASPPTSSAACTTPPSAPPTVTTGESIGCCLHHEPPIRAARDSTNKKSEIVTPQSKMAAPPATTSANRPPETATTSSTTMTTSTNPSAPPESTSDTAKAQQTSGHSAATREEPADYLVLFLVNTSSILLHFFCKLPLSHPKVALEKSDVCLSSQ